MNSQRAYVVRIKNIPVPCGNEGLVASLHVGSATRPNVQLFNGTKQPWVKGACPNYICHCDVRGGEAVTLRKILLSASIVL